MNPKKTKETKNKNRVPINKLKRWTFVLNDCRGKWERKVVLNCNRN